MFDNLFNKFKEKNSKETAKERLQIVLIHDRINLNPKDMKDMKKDLLEVVSNYLEVETENLDIDFSKQEKLSLIASVPVLNSKDNKE